MLGPAGPYLDTQAEHCRAAFRAAVQSGIAPFAARADREAALPVETLAALRSLGALGATLREADGGRGMDATTYGLLTAEVGRACSAARTTMTVHELVAVTVARWGNPQIKQRLLPALSSGDRLGAVAMSERDAGSDLAAISTTAFYEGDEIRLLGNKAWISLGQIADLFLVFARSERGPVAVAVPGNTPGLRRQPVTTMTGIRGSMMADLSFDNCRVPANHVIGKPGFGLSHVAATALDFGRFCVAWGALGIAEACLAITIEHARVRKIFNRPMTDHDLVRRRLAHMGTATRAAGLLCWKAAQLRQDGRPEAILETMIAKYFASRVAVEAADAAVQLHGARGLSQEYPVERMLRDAKVTEIIEGSTEVQEVVIGAEALLQL